MTTTKENLAQFAEGNATRGEYMTKLFDMLSTIATEVEDADTATLAAQAAAEIALWDSEIEQKEIANLLAVVESPQYTQMHRDRARDRVLIMLGLTE